MTCGDDFDVYAYGPVYCSVCSSLSMKETRQRLNIAHPSGAGEPWILADENFRCGRENPCFCDDHPETHKHYLFEIRKVKERLLILIEGVKL